MKRKRQLIIFIKGLLMGAADIVPGVSGGTMAFITGIYERLINAIHSIDFSLVADLRQGNFLGIRKKVDGTFLFLLLLGITTSIVGLSGVISAGLRTIPHLMYAFFAGLIIASAEMIYTHVKVWNRKKYLIGLIALCIGVALTQLTPATIEPSYLIIFLAGAIAISAMILPGISGSFILLMMGMYEPIITAVHMREVGPVLVFMLGAIVGLLSFVRLVKYMFTRYHDGVIAALIGLMLGSLPKLWPWAQTEFAYACPTTTPWSTILWIVGVFFVGYFFVKVIENYSHTKRK